MRWLLDTPFSKGLSARTKKTISHLTISPGMKVLDVGCGPGRLTIPLAEAVGPHGEVTGIDIQEGMLHNAQERANRAHLTNIRFLRIGAGEGRLERDYYDRAVLVTVLGEIPDREAALRDIFSALKPGGSLLIEEIILDPHFQTHGTVIKLGSAAGFIEKSFSGNRFSYILILEKPAVSGL